MCYDRSGCGKLYRKYEAVFLGFWHTYKQLCLLFFKCFANTFIAPLFHHLYPSTEFFVKPKLLSSIVAMMSTIRLSYPLFKDYLDEVLEDKVGKLDESSKILLLNLKSMVVFFIPAVSADVCQLVLGAYVECLKNVSLKIRRVGHVFIFFIWRADNIVSPPTLFREKMWSTFSFWLMCWTISSVIDIYHCLLCPCNLPLCIIGAGLWDAFEDRENESIGVGTCKGIEDPLPDGRVLERLWLTNVSKRYHTAVADSPALGIP